MKKSLITVCLLAGLLTSSLFAQTQLSTSSKLLLEKSRTHTDRSQSNDHDWSTDAFLPLIPSGDSYIVSGMMQVNDEFDASDFAAIGGSIGSRSKVATTFRLPLGQFEAMTQLAGIDFIQVDSKVFPKLDASIVDTHVDQVQAGTGLSQAYTGDGVIVGIIDIALDMTHPTFRDENGDSRIMSVWIQNEASGTPPDGFSYGTQLTDPAEMLAMGATNTEESHGTHVASIAAGRGVGTDQMFKGMAPDADIIFVQVDFENAGQSGITDAINYIFSQATAQDKPAVINMSLGHHNGPHDGTTLFDTSLDALVGDGLIAVGSASNEGDSKIHLSYAPLADDTLKTLIPTFLSDGAAEIAIWGEVGTVFSAKLEFFSSVDAQLLAETDFFSANTDNEDNLSFLDGNIEISRAAVAADMFNNKPNIALQVQINPEESENVLTRFSIIGTSGTLHAWSEATFDSFEGPGLTDGDSEYSVNEVGGIPNGIITVGAHTTKTSFQTLAGTTSAASGTVIGELAPFSSHGPTVDGRTKPEISAPGDVVVAAVNSYFPLVEQSYPTAFEFTEGGNSWFFGGASGTSMSAPTVAGIVALMLQADPTLNPAETKEVLQSTARTDEFTGVIPEEGSQLWGFGKVDALAAIQELEGLVSVEELATGVSAAIAYPNPTRDQITLSFNERIDKAVLRLTDLRGLTIVEQQLGTVENTEQKVDISDLPAGVYMLTVTGDDVQQAVRVIKE